MQFFVVTIQCQFPVKVILIIVIGIQLFGIEYIWICGLQVVLRFVEISRNNILMTYERVAIRL
ncbi:hypothetical protein HMPREF0645_0577 [Hallella bergensis DSM 17361]|uniref:Uncharacterized protein n=1 Tax=Hallella bergensis DSM 17361 TaxID=585502 RepID=D1PUE2_9BACT|nr:hypothetical protein HMPREF0645_0577 [Hallella bergensis DSM 17361]